MPTLLIIAGPNGCGKSTLTRMSGISGIEVIDPDAIADGMSPGQGAREALRRRRCALEEKRSYLVETTLAGIGILSHMEAARSEGYRIVLHYVSLSSPIQAGFRIINRVALGGHDVPEADARRRFLRSHSNLPTAAALADEVVFYDNTNPENSHRVVAIFERETKEFRISDGVPDWAAPTIPRVMISLADDVIFYDNTNPDKPHRVVAKFKRATLQDLDDVSDWAAPKIAHAMTRPAG